MSDDDEIALLAGRSELRADPRPEDPRARAAARAASLREHGGLDDDGIDEFFIDPKSVPDGWTYEWKRRTVLNVEDPSYQVSLARQGWEEVPASRHPEMMPKDGRHTIIDRKGMVLMERPTETVEESKKRDLRRARNQVRVKEEQLNSAPPGQLPRDEDSRTKASIKRNFERLEIPD